MFSVIKQHWKTYSANIQQQVEQVSFDIEIIVVSINDGFPKRIKHKHIDEKMCPVGMDHPVAKKSPSLAMMADGISIKLQPAKQLLVVESVDWNENRKYDYC